MLTVSIVIFTLNLAAAETVSTQPGASVEASGLAGEAKKDPHAHHSSGHAEGESHNHAATLEKKGTDTLIIKVKGMVCAFCAQGVTKSFNSQEEVESTNVDLDKMQVSVKLKKGKSLSEAKIKKLVTDSGFSFESVSK